MLITQGARAAEHFRQPTLFYRSAREGCGDLLDGLKAAGQAGPILLPAFIGYSAREGSGVFDPVRASGLPADFYALNDDLTIDLDSLEAALAAHPCRLLFVIHYFGRTEPRMDRVRALADQYGALLIEDLAHGFFSALVGGTAGRHADVNIYSLHKMLPFPNGGMVQYRTVNLLGSQRETAPEMARRTLDYDWPGIAAARRATFLQIDARLRALPGLGRDFSLLWPDLADGDVPQTLPVRIYGSQRDALYTAMNQAGFGMTSLYHTLIDDIGPRFADMIALSKHITNFPVHQDVNPDRIEAMVALFGKLASG